jgi:GNAT superfamily N-acetyltransferase
LLSRILCNFFLKVIARRDAACFDARVTNTAVPVSVEVAQGAALLPHLDELARLRISVFRDWPYLYAGDIENERGYLKAFTKSKSATMVLAHAKTASGSMVVGVATAMALSEETAAIRTPFAEAGHDVSQWFYLAESVLQHDYRGRGLGHAFFDEREAAGKRAGFRKFTFCAVERSDSDARRPADARNLEPFWRQRGYAPLGFSCALKWKEVGSAVPTQQTLRFWGLQID